MSFQEHMRQHKSGGPVQSGSGAGGGFRDFMNAHRVSATAAANSVTEHTISITNDISARAARKKTELEIRDDPVLAVEKKRKREKWKNTGKWALSKVTRGKLGATPQDEDGETADLSGQSPVLATNAPETHPGTTTGPEQQFWDSLKPKKEPGKVERFTNWALGEGNPVSYLLFERNRAPDSNDMIFDSDDAERIRAMHKEGAERADRDREARGSILKRATDAVRDFGKPKIGNSEG
ncbi:MAG: hypothetical protein ABIG39_01780 [Candidatus Micrarchaeota archaeon]